MALLFFLILLLLCRLIYLRHDTRLPTPHLLLLSGLLLLAVPALSVSPALVFVLLPLALLGLWGTERLLPARGLNEWRLLGLLLVVVPAVPLHGLITEGPLFSALLGGTGLSDAALRQGTWVLLGFLLVAHEANLPIRSLLRWSGLAPRDDVADTEKEIDTVVDRQEYNAGRLIGLTERWLMYTILVAAEEYNVIAFVLAAKGFARFRQMDQRAFAEYVLIGTLASTFFTVIISLLVLYNIR